MSLANKYRPQTFDEMIGQEHIIDILKAQMLARDTVHHNYLLFWPRGTGKTTSARLIAKGLNCLNLQNGNPCNHCANCELINTGTSLDYVEIDAASHTGVDNIREEIIDKVLYPPTALRKKIYVIDEVHMLSKGAFNALLKTIEEPKSNVCFIFATTEIHKVPDTIISRCQVFNYRKVKNDVMVQYLLHIAKAEGLEATVPALEIIASISEGCVRDAVKYVDQVSILGAINEENITRFLGVAGESTIKNLIATIKTWTREQIFAQLDQINQNGIDLGQFAKQIIGYIDQHLLEDVDFLLQCSELFWKVLSTLKRYPYPIVAYKIAVNSYLKSDQEVWSSVSQVQKPNILSENTIIQKNNAQETVVKKPEPTVVQSSEEKESISEKKSSEVPSNPASTPSQSTPSVQISNPSSDPKKLWEAVISKLQKPTVQSNLKDQAIIEKIEGNQIFLIVITKIAEMLLNNEENKKQIEWFLTEELWVPVQLVVSFEKKEDYFARKMGL